MDMEHRIAFLERQNRRLTYSLVAIIAFVGLGFVMGAAVVTPEKGELLHQKKITIDDASGHEVAIIDATGIKYLSDGTISAADISASDTVTCKSVEASDHIRANDGQKYAMIGFSGTQCVLVMGNDGVTKYCLLGKNGIVRDDFARPDVRYQRLDLGRNGSANSVTNPNWKINNAPTYKYELGGNKKIVAIWATEYDCARLRVMPNGSSLGTNTVELTATPLRPGYPNAFMALPDDPIWVHVLYHDE